MLLNWGVPMVLLGAGGSRTWDARTVVLTLGSEIGNKYSTSNTVKDLENLQNDTRNSRTNYMNDYIFYK